jgi:outer membrane protein assembly factor BamD (BamD/ComL family)
MLEEVLQIAPQFDNMDSVLYFLAAAKYRLGLIAEARADVEELLRRYPASELAGDARRALSELLGAGP